MRWARALILLLAAGAAAGAAAVARKAAETPPALHRPLEAPKAHVLVAGRAIMAGETVAERDIVWQPWPADATPSGAIVRRTGEAAPRFEAARARYPLLEGEPLAEEKLVRSGGGSLMAASMTPGMRAAAIPLREEIAAGGLIQPGDRVDILWTPQSAEAGGRLRRSRMLLRGAKVLAVGASTQAKGRAGEARTATLELTPEQASLIASARAGGELSLALIPASETPGPPQMAETVFEDAEAGVRILKFGRQPESPASLSWRNR